VELTATVKNRPAKFDAMAAAHKARHPEVVLMILSDQIVVRSRRSGQWPIRDHQRGVPTGPSPWSTWTTPPASRSTASCCWRGAGHPRKALCRRPQRASRQAPKRPESANVGLSLGETQHRHDAWTGWAAAADPTTTREIRRSKIKVVGVRDGADRLRPEGCDVVRDRFPSAEPGLAAVTTNIQARQ
jgi:hypothetical protein